MEKFHFIEKTSYMIILGWWGNVLRVANQPDKKMRGVYCTFVVITVKQKGCCSFL